MKFVTAICYDLIAQPPGGGLFLGAMLQDARAEFGDINYLLVPQCNLAPKDGNFQRAVVDLYHDPQVQSQILRVVSPNVAHQEFNGETKLAGQSWFVTCPFGSSLPRLGIWERSLPSEQKDPKTGELIPDVPSLGHFAQRLRLSAPGEWLLHLKVPPAEHLIRESGPNVPLVPHDGRVMEWIDGDWRQKDPSEFERDCLFAESLPGLKLLVELPEWLKSNYGGMNTYSPSYEEFVEHAVILPKNDRDTAHRLLGESKDIWIRGPKASGKTVFGLGIALEWMERNNGRCLFYDLTDIGASELEFSSLISQDISWFATQVQQPLLILLDNVHIADGAAFKTLVKIQEMRSTGGQIQAVLLGQFLESTVTERKTLQDVESLARINLKVAPEAFICVAKRLAKRIGMEHDIGTQLASDWLSVCGGDLVIFSATFDPLNPEAISKSSIATHVRQRYLTTSDREPGGRSAFLELCVLGSLDMGANDTEIWEEGVESLFPALVTDGAILRVTEKRANPLEHCRLFHSSMGELILQVQCNFSEVEYQQLRLEKLLELSRKVPRLFSLIDDRLRSSSYSNEDVFLAWQKLVKNTDGLIERAICHSPHRTIHAVRSSEYSWSWERLCSLTASEGYNVLVERLPQTPADLIVLFLKTLDEQGLQDASKALVGQLLDSEEFTVRLTQIPVDLVVIFLKYLNEQGMSESSNNLLTGLLNNEDFNSRLARTSVETIVFFLKYLNHEGFQEASINLLTGLLLNEELELRLARSSVVEIMTFLKYLQQQELLVANEGLINDLLNNEEFRSRLKRTSVDLVVRFLKYLDRQNLSDSSVDLLRELLGQDEFKLLLDRTSANHVVVFLKYLDQQGLSEAAKNLQQELRENEEIASHIASLPWNPALEFLRYRNELGDGLAGEQLIVEFVEADEFAKVFYDLPPYDQAPLIEFLTDREDKKTAQELIDKSWGQIDDELFVQRLGRWKPYAFSRLQKSISESQLTLPPERWAEMTKKVYGNSYTPVAPDSEYPQEIILAMPMTQLVILFSDLSILEPRPKHKMNCIMMSITSNEERFHSWIRGLLDEEKELFKEMIVGLHLRVPPAGWAILSGIEDEKSA
ncbi:MAG: hypothetical protein IH872_11320 [Chloroflexi bacterium]|nr:hypothetical protein [Chloroflexota bacterium]